MASSTDRIELILGGWTDPGLKEPNQDAFLVNEGLGLAVVCDGVSTGGGGDIAAVLTVQQIETFLQLSAGRRLGKRLLRAVEVANDSLKVFRGEGARPGIGRSGKGLELPDMKTTVVALAAGRYGLELCWAGDSRCYRYRNGHLEALTKDDAQSEGGGAITSAIGGLRSFGPNYTVVSEVEAGDLFLLCTDGLYKRDRTLGKTRALLEVKQREIAACAGEGGSGPSGELRRIVGEASRQLVNQVEPGKPRAETGSDDNIAVVLAYVHSVPSRSGVNLDEDTRDPQQENAGVGGSGGSWIPPEPPAPPGRPPGGRPGLPPPPVPVAPPISPPSPPRRRLPFKLVAASVIVLALLLAAGVGLWKWWNTAPKPPDIGKEVDNDLKQWPYDGQCEMLARNFLQGNLDGENAARERELLHQCRSRYLGHFDSLLAKKTTGGKTERQKKETAPPEIAKDLKNPGDVWLRRYAICWHGERKTSSGVPAKAGGNAKASPPPDPRTRLFKAMRWVLEGVEEPEEQAQTKKPQKQAQIVVRWLGTDGSYGNETWMKGNEKKCWEAISKGLKDQAKFPAGKIQLVGLELGKLVPTPTPTRTFTPPPTFTPTPTLTPTQRANTPRPTFTPTCTKTPWPTRTPPLTPTRLEPTKKTQPSPLVSTATAAPIPVLTPSPCEELLRRLREYVTSPSRKTQLRVQRLLINNLGSLNKNCKVVSSLTNPPRRGVPPLLYGERLHVQIWTKVQDHKTDYQGQIDAMSSRAGGQQ